MPARQAILAAVFGVLPLIVAAQQTPAPQQPAAQPAAADPVLIRAAVLRVDDAGLPPISRLDLPTEDLGFAGARLAIDDNDTTGRFMG